jgi:hypothetical protein
MDQKSGAQLFANMPRRLPAVRYGTQIWSSAKDRKISERS